MEWYLLIDYLGWLKSNYFKIVKWFLEVTSLFAEVKGTNITYIFISFLYGWHKFKEEGSQDGFWQKKFYFIDIKILDLEIHDVFLKLKSRNTNVILF